MSTTQDFETISTDTLDAVTGGGFWGDLRDAGLGAINIVRNPIGAAARGINGVAGARAQGHSWSDSAANGLVQAAGTMNAPNLAHIPAQ
jgi:hypothetical protein